MNITMLFVVGFLGLLALGGAVFAFAGVGAEKTKKRVAQLTKASASPRVAKGQGDGNQQRRKNVAAMIKELEKQKSQHQKRPSLRRRIEQAGLEISLRNFWIASAVTGVVGGLGSFLIVKSVLAIPLAGFAFAFGFPRWVLQFLKNRREKAFTEEFAPAIDTIVRSVKSGLPVNEALKLVGAEIPEPVGGEFRLLTEGLKVGVTMEDGLKRMYERMPTAEVNFFAIVMSIQQKAGGNLSEALGNLAGVLRERKRLKGKIRAMSSEAKTGAIIIGSLPPGVAGIVYVTTPDYIKPLFTVAFGNVLLMGCAVWMSIGIFIMKKMISFRY
jgi:tight adherence protein B